MIYKNLLFSEFYRYFMESSYRDNFSYKGLMTLYNILSYQDKNVKFDIVIICSRFQEYTIKEARENYIWLEDLLKEEEQEKGRALSQDEIHDLVARFFDGEGIPYYWVGENSVIVEDGC